MSDATSGGNPYQCNTCGAAIPSSHRNPNCPKCFAKLSDETVATLRKEPAPSESKGSAGACIGLGVIALCAGLYFLINPSASGYSNVANMHALALGQTFTVAGAVLLGFGIRPR